MTFGTTVGVPLAKKLLKQCYDAGVNLCGPPYLQYEAGVSCCFPSTLFSQIKTKAIFFQALCYAALTTQKSTRTARLRRSWGRHSRQDLCCVLNAWCKRITG